METVRTRLIALRKMWEGRRWRLRLAAWALFVLLAAVLPHEPDQGPGYLIGLIVLCAVLAVVDARPLMTAGFGLILASIARLLTLDPGFSPYVDGVTEPWVAVELLVLPLAALPPLVLTWAIVSRRGKEALAWVRLPGEGVAPDT